MLVKQHKTSNNPVEGLNFNFLFFLLMFWMYKFEVINCYLKMQFLQWILYLSSQSSKIELESQSSAMLFPLTLDYPANIPFTMLLHTISPTSHPARIVTRTFSMLVKVIYPHVINKWVDNVQFITLTRHDMPPCVSGTISSVGSFQRRDHHCCCTHNTDCTERL